jgi:predicted enzyme related to lactoylglutathione lyase
MTKDPIAPGSARPRASFGWLAAAFAAAALLGGGFPAPARAAHFPPLNQPATKQLFPGKFIWADLFTSEPETAAAFYCSLFGWTAAPIEQSDKSYIILSNGGQPVAGIVLRSPGTAKRPGLWIGYIAVANAKATLTAVEAAGGTIRAPAHKFPNRGVQAILTESEGSVVGILQSSSGDPADDEPKTGEWNWFELFSQKPQAAADFYGRAFGYEVHADMRADKTGHLVLSSGGRARAGIAPLPASADSQPGWLGCVRVTDIEATTARVVAMGGVILVAPRPAALGSRFAAISDPTGGTVGLVQYVDNANPADRP